ncbi:head-tail connector protein [Pantoea sp. 18069]|uniref:head-tail connector protein n=1 Tax=Pantoea sp. 18069 TaxID=2681415 RepID=UPI001358E168|nr:head-tail connector protein [Pantoea sp. 18069]
MTIVTLEQARLHLRVAGDSENSLIAIYLSAAEATAAEFLNRNVYATQAELEAAAEPPEAMPIVINGAVQAAVLLILGHLYANRENSAIGVSAQELPMGAHSLLQPYRIGLGV